MNKKLVWVLLAVFFGVAAFFAVSCRPPEVLNGEDGLSGNLVIGGSTSVAVAAEVLAMEFRILHPEVNIEVQSVGSSAGIVGANDETFDIGMSSRDLGPEEKAWGLHEVLICRDAIATIIHPDNPVRDLTLEQVRGIFLGEIRNWGEVGGNDAEITVVVREAGSGTRGAFEDIVHEDLAPFERAIYLVGTGGVRAGVAGDVDAIGYISTVAVDPTIRALSVDGVEPTLEQVRAGNYPIARPYIFMTKGEPIGLAKEFIDWVMSEEGQAILEEEGYVTM